MADAKDAALELIMEFASRVQEKRWEDAYLLCDKILDIEPTNHQILEYKRILPLRIEQAAFEREDEEEGSSGESSEEEDEEENPSSESYDEFVESDEAESAEESIEQFKIVFTPSIQIIQQQMAAMKYDPDYDFSNDGVDWEDYYKEVRLRTDAVWERQKLKDYFRLFYKVFNYDPVSKNYYVAMPLFNDYNRPDNWRFRQFESWNPTGKTMSYEKSHGVEYPFRTISIGFSDALRDKNVLCYYRFRAFKKCEGNSMNTVVDESDVAHDGKVNRACYRELTEMTQWCSTVQLNWLADLWHHMELAEDPTTFANSEELRQMVDLYDNPDRKVFTY